MTDTAEPQDPNGLVFRWQRNRNTRMVTWNAVQHDVDELARQIREQGLAPAAFVGIFQGGWVIAQCLADHFPGTPVLGVAEGLPPAESSITLVDSRDGMLAPSRLPAGAAVVLVDEVIDSGRTAAFFKQRIEEQYAVSARLACLASATSARPVPEFAARRMDQLPGLVLPWRVLRDFDQTIACLLHSVAMATEEIDERLRELGHDYAADVLDAQLRNLAEQDFIIRGADNRWKRTDR